MPRPFENQPKDSHFPIVIEFSGHHGLEDSAEEGVDFCKYLLVEQPEDLPNNIAFTIIATKVWRI